MLHYGFLQILYSMQKLLVFFSKCGIAQMYNLLRLHLTSCECNAVHVWGARQCVRLLCLLLLLGVIREPTLQLQLLLLHRRAHPKVTTTIPISYSHHHHHVHQHHCYQDHLHMLVQGVIPTCSCSCPPVERRHPQVITITII